MASPNEILGLKNIAENKLTYQIWNLVCAIYGHLCILRMLPYLCDIRKEYAQEEKKKLENKKLIEQGAKYIDGKKVHEGIDESCYSDDDMVSQNSDYQADGP